MKKFLFGLLGCVALLEAETKETVVTDQKVYELHVSEDDASVIEQLVTVMGERNLFYLFANQSYVKDLGRKTRNIPSSQFLGYVFAHPELVASMKKISTSSVKWKRFTKGIIRGLDNEANDALFEELESFAHHTGSDYKQLRELAKARKWNDFLLFLLK